MADVNLYPQLNIEALIVLVAATVIGILLAFTPLFYPFQLLFTTVHELGHVLATLLTGGTVKGFWVYFKAKNGTLGETMPDGGNWPYIISGGYLGTALFSTGLILLSGLPYAAPYIVAILGAILILLVWLYSAQSFQTLIIGLAWGAAFIWIAWNAALIWSVFLLYLLAVLGGVTALSDWREITQLARENPQGKHDAALMAKFAGRSALFWATLWSVTTFLLISAAFWFTWLRNISQ